jgi:hypothetical protein
MSSRLIESLGAPCESPDTADIRSIQSRYVDGDISLQELEKQIERAYIHGSDPKSLTAIEKLRPYIVGRHTDIEHVLVSPEFECDLLEECDFVVESDITQQSQSMNRIGRVFGVDVYVDFNVDEFAIITSTDDHSIRHQ